MIGGGQLFYHDLLDPSNLSRKEKLTFLNDNRKKSVRWKSIDPDDQGDWINQRDPCFTDLLPLYGEDGSVFNMNSPGIQTNRDPWSYGFGKQHLTDKTLRLTTFFNSRIPTSRLDWSPKDFKRTPRTDRMARDGIKLEHDPNKIVISEYRPFCKQNFYFDPDLIHRIGQHRRTYPTANLENIGIYVSDKDKNNSLSCLMTNVLPNLELVFHGQYVPRWTYEKSPYMDGYEKVSNINPSILTKFRDHYTDNNISEDDLFHYVYGMLHHQGLPHSVRR